MEYSKAVAKRLKELLDEYGYTQYQLSKESGVPQSTISSILKMKTKSPNSINIVYICFGFGIELTEFFDRDYFKLENLEV